MSFKINTKLTLMSIVAAAFLSVHTTAGDIGKDGTKSKLIIPELNLQKQGWMGQGDLG